MSKTHNAALEKLFLNAQKNKENEKKTFERSKKKYRLVHPHTLSELDDFFCGSGCEDGCLIEI